jgi:uncharacterized protein YdeI (YjbR/CyaY-like superfamily)
MPESPAKLQMMAPKTVSNGRTCQTGVVVIYSGRSDGFSTCKTGLLCDSVRVARLAGAAPRSIPGALGRLLQEGFGQTQHHVAGSGRRSACFGWIDGVRKSVDESSYTIRFTPRKSCSTWSAVNIKRMAELKKLGLVHSAGLQAFQRRTDDRSEIYAYEQRKGAKLTAKYEKLFRANKGAWTFFEAQPPWYRRTSSWWVISAKKEETRMKRLARLIDDSARNRPIPALTRPAGTRRSGKPGS